MTAQITAFSLEFLPQVIRLFSPNARVDGKLACYSEQYASYSGPEDVNLLLKNDKQLLASVQMISQGNSSFLLRVGVAPELDAGQWQFFWEHCCQAASQVAAGRPVSVKAVLASDSPAFRILEASGFKLTREINEMVADLTTLPAPTASELNVRLASLSEVPHLEQKWLDIFNAGLGSVVDVPPWEAKHFQRRSTAAGFDRRRWFLNLFNGEPVTAGYYELLDSSEGVAMLYLPLGSAHKIKGLPRQIVKDVLMSMQKRELSQVKLLLDTQSQAASLLLKLGGFQPQSKLVEVSMEGIKAISNPEPVSAPEPEPEEKEPVFTLF